ncbi:hypothetical protein [Desulfobulbus elongatus]|uniref:hypothetical protein n=1 Tax=Desulfobulbus elongatus TaxID=53332 RepID=UPI0004808F86|nr:hypothetical protein [Desulfobulbus elongatus]
MERETIMCVWREGSFDPDELVESRFLGGLVCARCDADEGSRTLGEGIRRLKHRSARSIEQGVGRVK